MEVLSIERMFKKYETEIKHNTKYDISGFIEGHRFYVHMINPEIVKGMNQKGYQGYEVGINDLKKSCKRQIDVVDIFREVIGPPVLY